MPCTAFATIPAAFDSLSHTHTPHRLWQGVGSRRLALFSDEICLTTQNPLELRLKKLPMISIIPSMLGAWVRSFGDRGSHIKEISKAPLVARESISQLQLASCFLCAVHSYPSVNYGDNFLKISYTFSNVNQRLSHKNDPIYR